MADTDRSLHEEGVLGVGASGVHRDSSVEGAGSRRRPLIVWLFGGCGVPKELVPVTSSDIGTDMEKYRSTTKNMTMVTFKFALMKRGLNNRKIGVTNSPVVSESGGGVLADGCGGG